MKTTELPNPASPTAHPDFPEEGMTPPINVFGVPPVTSARGLVGGDIVNINVATYVDPFAEMDYHRLVASNPRWVQGLLIRLNQIEPVYTEPGYRRYRSVFPADRVFSGVVTNHDAELPVVGVLHPGRYGWLAFE